MIEMHGSTRTSAHYARMAREDCEKIHAASLEILESVGVDIHDEKAREILVGGGARADGLRVRIPEFMVTRALYSAPERLTLYDRHGRITIRAWGYNTT
jgi:trimethylamine--corrinoid protein Co-methyltransferase